MQRLISLSLPWEQWRDKVGMHTVMTQCECDMSVTDHTECDQRVSLAQKRKVAAWERALGSTDSFPVDPCNGG